MRAKEAREIATKCVPHALKGDFERASRIRQEAYAKDPPGSIGIDWSDYEYVWKRDFRFLQAMQQEDFSDLQNSARFIASLQAALYIDMLFCFRDMWAEEFIFGVEPEQICCPLMDEFFRKKDWPRENKLFVYCTTKRSNIGFRIYNSSPLAGKIKTPETLQFFPKGEYNLGFLPNTPQRVIDARKRWLQTKNLHEDMRKIGINGLPKTLSAFEKHFLANDQKYQDWYRQYQDAISRQTPQRVTERECHPSGKVIE